MLTRIAAALCGLTLAATAATTLPAQAAGGITVTSPSCGTLKITNNYSDTSVVSLDSGDDFVIGAHRSVTTRTEGGPYVWIWGPYASEFEMTAHRVTVKPCANGPVRPVEGDENGDGKADVLGIQAGSGNLYYYRTTPTGLASGVKAGTGWGSTVFAQRVNEIDGSGTRNVLFALRQDGTAWLYDNLGQGRFANGRQVGRGFGGYTAFAVTQSSNPLNFGGHLLVARKGGLIYGFELTGAGLAPGHEFWEIPSTISRHLALKDFDGNGFSDLLSIRTDGTLWFTPEGSAEVPFGTPRRVGTGWNAMATVSSPGSLDGDALSDLVARRSDGNLYTYRNLGGRWAPAAKIGNNWNAMRVLA